MNNLKKLRENKGLTKKALDDMCGVSDAYIYQIEKGVRPMSSEIVTKLANYFGVSTEHIYDKITIPYAMNLSELINNLISYYTTNLAEYDIDKEKSIEIIQDIQTLLRKHTTPITHTKGGEYK